ncbi:MAG TPA: NAD-dependent epimerase/dehydratase family protein [Pelagibacterales bacterium]|nr:NAD-dependent epimerase/dehydratase family protein [Pelagibacterales bacterium]
MHFAVTGDVGFIGSHIVKNLIKKGHYASVIDNLNAGWEK